MQNIMLCSLKRTGLAHFCHSVNEPLIAAIHINETNTLR
jgi:hypothetical protein